eukprot:COSAG05_NODE_1282_length_5283_cov_4.584684_6_plen_104_part_00
MGLWVLVQYRRFKAGRAQQRQLQDLKESDNPASFPVFYSCLPPCILNQSLALLLAHRRCRYNAVLSDFECAPTPAALRALLATTAAATPAAGKNADPTPLVER